MLSYKRSKLGMLKNPINWHFFNIFLHYETFVQRSHNVSNVLNPVHPGEILKHEFMEPFGLSSNRFAKHIGVTPARINEIVRARWGITADTALRLAQYFNTNALLHYYELEVAEQAIGEEVANIQPIAAAA